MGCFADITWAPSVEPRGLWSFGHRERTQVTLPEQPSQRQVSTATSTELITKIFVRVSYSSLSPRSNLALNRQSLHTNDLALRPTDNPVLYPRVIPRDRIDPHIVPLTRISHRVNQFAVLSLLVPVGRISNGNIRVVGIPVVDQFRELD